MDHSKHTSLSFDELDRDVVVGATILDGSDQRVGSVSHLHGEGARSGVVVAIEDYGDLGGKQVSVPANAIDFMRDEAGDVHGVLQWTADELAAMPEHTDPA
jgi:hypothetical protein